MRLTPLGDQVWLAYLDDETAALRFARAIREASPPWLQDVVPAYGSVGIFFDADATSANAVRDWLTALAWDSPSANPDATVAATHTIPVCYERGPDLARVADLTGLPGEAVIGHHLAGEYRVYAIGFVPGFPYLGYLPPALTGLPRLPSPRLRVEAGSVGLAGKQTGLYPLARPGGWNLIGRTPLTLVDVADHFFPLKVGDGVRFTRIDDAEFLRLQGERLG